MRNAATAQGCPSSDDLSAFVDGTTPEELAIHIESCGRCQRQVKALRLIDAVIHRRLAPPDGLAVRVRARVRDQAGREPSAAAGWWVSPVLRLAAVLMVTTAALAVLVHVLNQRSNSMPTVAAQAGVGAPEVVQAAPAAGLGSDPEVEYVKGTMRPASTDRRGRAAGTPSDLPAEVRHVWTVADADGERAYLTSLLPQGAYEVSSQEDGNTVFTVVLPDRELQKLVDRLHDHRWQLASYQLPQPGSGSTVALRGQAVRYILTLVNADAPAPP